MLGPPIECAEAAIGNADIRVVDVSIDDIRNDVARMESLPDAVFLHAQLDERGIGVEIEKVARHHAAGRNVKVPFGTLPLSTRRR